MSQLTTIILQQVKKFACDCKHFIKAATTRNRLGSPCNIIVSAYNTVACSYTCFQAFVIHVHVTVMCKLL